MLLDEPVEVVQAEVLHADLPHLRVVEFEAVFLQEFYQGTHPLLVGLFVLLVPLPLLALLLLELPLLLRDVESLSAVTHIYMMPPITVLVI